MFVISTSVSILSLSLSISMSVPMYLGRCMFYWSCSAEADQLCTAASKANCPDASCLLPPASCLCLLPLPLCNSQPPQPPRASM